MAQEHPDSTPFVSVVTSPAHDPVLPAWLAEAVLVLQRAHDSTLLSTLQETVRVPRGRMGTFEVCDFVLLLIVYAVSAEDTLAAFYTTLPPCAAVLMALWQRDRMPSPSALSRFLGDVPATARDALRELLFNDLLTHGLQGPLRGGMDDRMQARHLVFDVDGTHQVARQRQLVTDDLHPPARRRLALLCAPGYSGRKRGEITRTRTTLQQAHTREWLGTWGCAGNGDYFADLDAACAYTARYLAARGMDLAQGVVRLDGLYGVARGAWQVVQHGLGYLMRVKDYRLLDLPAVQAALAAGPGMPFVQPDTGTARQVWDVPEVLWQAAGDDRYRVVTRLLVTARTAGPKEAVPKVGQRRKELIYELFATDREGRGLTAVDAVSLYFGRGGFEQTLAEEDRELELDRWCSGHPEGQELWQWLGQWVWNVRLRLGAAARDTVVRQTEWAAALPPQAPTTRPTSEAPESAPEPVLVPSCPPAPPVYTEPPAASPAPTAWVCGEVAAAAGRGAGKFGGSDFVWTPSGLLQCPNGQTLRPVSRGVEGDRERVMYGASVSVCACCALSPQCRGANASSQKGRRVSVWRSLPILSPPSAERPAPCGSVGSCGSVAPPALSAPVVAARTAVAVSPGGSAVLWHDVPSTQLRRVARIEIHGHRIELNAPRRAPVPPRAESRAQRAHRRLTWTERLARNAHPRLLVPWQIELRGVPAGIADYLGDLSQLRAAA